MAELIGQTVGPYRIIEQIGMGGMATVYKAYQASMDRYVAVKVLPRQFAEDPTFIGRFEQEARTIASLEHPHILPVHDYGQQDGTTYLVMRYVGGGTLKDLITSQGLLGLDEILRIMEQVGGALSYAHSRGVIHRDIKPSNVLIDPRGDCFLTDFGIARLVEGTTEFTATGRIVGTPAYMAPEQGMGEKADARSDIYALGIILYELATGKVPYEAETPLAVLMKHATAPLPLPRQVRPGLSESIERVILKALSKSPDDRFQRVEDMVAALRQAITAPEAAAAEVAAPPVFGQATALVDQAPATDMVPVAARRRPFPWVLPLVAGCGVLLIVLVVAAILVLPRPVSQLAEQASPPTEAEATSLSAEAAVPLTETPDEEGIAEATLAPTAGEGAAEATAASTVGEPGWTVFVSGDEVRALAAQDKYIWAGGSGGLVRWDRSNGSYRWFTTADGLASSVVNTLLVDPEGMLWVGTEGGLNRYDPNADRWITFDTADGLDSDNVIGLYYDTDGTLWAGAIYGDRGFNVYDGTEWRAPDIPPISIEFPKPRDFLRDNDGTLWVGLVEQGVARFDGSEWRTFVVNAEYPDAGVNDLALTSRGELLAATGGGVFRFNPNTETWDLVPQLEGFSTNAILEDSNGILWFAGDGGIMRFDPSASDWESYQSGSEELPGWNVTAVVEDADGALWFGLDSGLSRLKGGEWENWGIGVGPAGNRINSIVEDGAGNIWAVIDGGKGLSRYSPDSDTWKTFTEEDSALNWPNGLTVDREGRVWIGGWASARFFDGKAWQTFENPALGETDVRAITQDESGAMWFGADGGIVRFDPGDGNVKAFTTNDGLPEGETYQLCSTDGLMLANVGNELMVFDGTGWRRELPGQEEIYQIAVGPAGEVWVAGGNWLFVYDGKTWDMVESPDLWIAVLTVGPDGMVWAGSGDGLARFNPEDKTWKRLGPGDGALPNYVTAILVAHDGALWVGTSAGMGRYMSP